ncbi:hypothetical protein PR202_gb14951 [Eleusine coracana subsp. coracana]|uniref:Glycosyltransferase n=1 Tax=Eleusine coracana subsp. coracana TaxID=191504 RepID=A0AAV5EXL5_ELECO|nr:hypothetical protein QOZ80_4BG0341190 [Eleusine coracana subsp. coracana]GJN26980.1 hypothetical protein PR202_gb14951 [Eleusine coracana subsp. coracana]
MGAEAVFHHQPVSLLLVPFPAQGHVTPMLHLARALAAYGGVAATVAVPDFIHRRIVASNDGVALACIPSGVAEDGGDTPGFAAIAHAMENHMPAQLERVLLARRRPRFACVVVDVLASWAVPVAERCGVPVAGFWPAMLACYRVVAAIPELIQKGLISESGTPISSNEQDDKEEDLVIRGLQILPEQVELRTKDLPWLVGDKATQTSRFAFWMQTLRRARSFRWVLVNSFHGEDDDDNGGCADDDAHRKQPAKQSPRVLPVRPALLPAGNNVADERTKPQQQPCSIGKSNSPSMWRADASCIGWLDAQVAGSVVYVSFGSWVGPIGPDKVRELALGLEASGRPFLWALKRDAAWRSGLPDGFAEAEGRGKVVDWAPQEDVLRHPAVGCYLTHCGWNSTVEAIQHGVRLLCCPVAGDQFINCAYITGLWGIGRKLDSVSRDDVKAGVERVMDDEEGRRLQENVTALREKVVTAEARCTAENNVTLFIDEIKREQPLLMQMYNASL